MRLTKRRPGIHSTCETIVYNLVSGADMNSLRMKSRTKIAAGLMLIIAASFSQSVLAGKLEEKCKSHIQGKIAWDTASNYDSASKWDEKNLSYLCKDTINPKAPGECFHGVMTGHVNHGESDKWEYQNAIELCKGTSNADETINCFKGKIAEKVDWETAIKQCQAKPNLENVAK